MSSLGNVDDERRAEEFRVSSYDVFVDNRVNKVDASSPSNIKTGLL